MENPKPQRIAVPYHHVPNTYVGRFSGFEECQLYAFFPHLYYKGRPTNYLTDDQLERFFNIVLQAIINCGDYDSETLQHFPTSFKHAELASYAKSRESGSTFTSRMHSQLSLHYFLHARGLLALYQMIQQMILESRYFDLTNMIFLISAKNLKTMFRCETPKDLFGEYQEKWNYIFDFQYLPSDNCWIDIGKETVNYAYHKTPTQHTDITEPESSSSARGEHGSSTDTTWRPHQPVTYLWKKSCLEKRYQE